MKRRHNRRARAPQPPRFDPRKPLRVIGVGLFLASALYAGFVLLDRPIRAVDIEGPFKRVSAMQIEAAIAGRLAPGRFLSTDLGAVREAVAALPWVDRVRIRRRWPFRLVLHVTEQVAAARWGEQGLLNTRGELFVSDARHLPSELPRLDGPPGTEWQVAQLYLSLHAELLALGLEVAALELDTRGAWSLELGNGVEVRLGRVAADARIERFLQELPRLITARLEDIRYVDMRYSNGFAIGWRKPSEPPAAEASDV